MPFHHWSGNHHEQPGVSLTPFSLPNNAHKHRSQCPKGPHIWRKPLSQALPLLESFRPDGKDPNYMRKKQKRQLTQTAVEPRWSGSQEQGYLSATSLFKLRG